MINQVIGKGVVQLTPKELEKIQSLIPHELPNANMYETKVEFKMMGQDGKWLLFSIIEVNGEDELEKGVNIFANRIELI
jgi:predicted SprT family Zn-dependent metalloprotease